MKENKTYFFLALATIILAFFLLYKIRDNKKVYQSLKAEYDNYKTQQETKQEWSEIRYWSFTFKYPKDWHLAIFFPNDDRTKKTYAINPFPIDMTAMGFSKGVYELTIYDDQDIYNDEYWQKEQESYLKELDQVDKEVISTEYGSINFYKGKEKQDNAIGQNVEAYFYKFNYILKTEKEDIKKTVYLKLEMLYLTDWRYSKMMREIATSFKPI